MSRHAARRSAALGWRRVHQLICGLGIIAGVAQGVGCSRYVEDKWSRARPATHRAGGVVEYRGQPLSRATITFVGRDDASGKEFSAVGLTDDRGRFRLQTFRPADGAVAGSHRVKIEKQSLGGGSAAAVKPPTNREEYEAELAAQAKMRVGSEIPPRYGSFDTSGLTAEVTEKGPNEFAFKLDDSGPPKPRR